MMASVAVDGGNAAVPCAVFAATSRWKEGPSPPDLEGLRSARCGVVASWVCARAFWSRSE